MMNKKTWLLRDLRFHMLSTHHGTYQGAATADFSSNFPNTWFPQYDVRLENNLCGITSQTGLGPLGSEMLQSKTLFVILKIVDSVKITHL